MSATEPEAGLSVERRAELRARLDRESRFIDGRVDLPALSYRDGYALLDALDVVERERDEARAAVADAWDLGWCAGVSRFTQRSEPPKDNPYRATCPPDCERDHAPCGRDRWVEAAERITDPNTASDA